jgi:hypothetical protein
VLLHFLDKPTYSKFNEYKLINTKKKIFVENVIDNYRGSGRANQSTNLREKDNKSSSHPFWVWDPQHFDRTT